jgi:hypothetical protein
MSFEKLGTWALCRGIFQYLAKTFAVSGLAIGDRMLTAMATHRILLRVIWRLIVTPDLLTRYQES